MCVACLPVAVSVRVQLERERAYVERGWRQNGWPKLAGRDGSGWGGSTETHVEHGERARDGGPTTGRSPTDAADRARADRGVRRTGRGVPKKQVIDVLKR